MVQMTQITLHNLEAKKTGIKISNAKYFLKSRVQSKYIY